ncbi:uridine kinase family protein [Amycolatopsis anabasis]|uniref:uridine kinase family protein n=1 Tax=Amycolatopsis anabasis TaxID=1840409 RepID=UPI00131B5716|nr:uridine kinase [Amycolatopsis anabasis]
MTDELVDQVLAAPARLGGVRVLAIDGPSGAGKSTYAGEVVEEFRRRGVRTGLVSTDDFATWDDPVAWWPRLVDGVLEPLEHGTAGSYRVMDWTTGEPRLGARKTVQVPEVLVLEGVSAGRASVRRHLAHLCWIDGPSPEARLERAVRRDGEPSRNALESWQKFERGWFAVDCPAQHADTSFGVAVVR